MRKVAATLDPTSGSLVKRKARFEKLKQQFQRSPQPVRQTMAKTMQSFAPGLFVGGDDPDLPRDNLDLERFFRCPKGHERRIHGHRHAGVRIVSQGPTLLPTLDAHLQQPELFLPNELRPYAHAQTPSSQQSAQCRHRIMRQARSSKYRPLLLKQLERLYCASP